MLCEKGERWKTLDQKDGTGLTTAYYCTRIAIPLKDDRRIDNLLSADCSQILVITTDGEILFRMIFTGTTLLPAHQNFFKKRSILLGYVRFIRGKDDQAASLVVISSPQ